MALTDLVEGFLKDRKYTGPMPEIHIGEKSFAVDSSKGYGVEPGKNGKEIIFISKASLNSPDVLQELGHELGYLVKYDKDEKIAENVGSKIDTIKPGEEKDYKEYLASIKDKYKDLPSLEESKVLENRIPDEYKKKFLVNYILSPLKTAKEGIVNKEDIKEIDGNYYYQGKKIGFYQDLKDGKIAYVIESENYVVEEVKSALIGIATAKVLAFGGRYIISTPLGKYVTTKTGKIIGKLKPGTNEFEFIKEPVSPNFSGTVNKSKIKNAGQEIIVNSLENKKLVQKIVKEGDFSGELTEELVNKLAKEKNMY